MKTFYLDLSTAPPLQASVQSCDPSYDDLAAEEAHVYMDQIKRCFALKDTIRMTIVSSGQGNWRYYQVRLSCPGDDAQAIEQITAVESKGPSHWDRLAYYQLAWYEQRRNVLGDREGRPQAVIAFFEANRHPPEPVPMQARELTLARMFEVHPLPLHKYVAEQQFATEEPA